MSDVSVVTREHLVKTIRAKLNAKPKEMTYHHFKSFPDPTESAAYVLVVGAGFSYGVMPLTRELMHETIGDYYYPDQDQSSMERPARTLQKYSASFWREFNEASEREGLEVVEVDHRGLPKEPGAAYRTLFTYKGANALFGPQEKGKKFVQGFLRYVLAPGSEHGSGAAGRNRLNPAHTYLAKLLEAQQIGQRWTGRAFCRTIFTTNFDTLLQTALRRVDIGYFTTDRPERGLNLADFPNEEDTIHLVYTHGSIARHNPASTTDELDGLAGQNITVLRDCLETRDVIIIGYSGWKDGLMAALLRCDSNKHRVYWCGKGPKPDSPVASFLEQQVPGAAAYVSLGQEGADGLMRDLYHTLIPEETR